MAEQNVDPNAVADKDKGKELPAKIMIKQGEVETSFGAEEVQALLTTTASVTPLIEAAKQFGLTPQALVENAGQAFGLVEKLIADGVLDETGKPIAKKVETEKPSGFEDLFGTPKDDTGKKTDLDPQSVGTRLEALVAEKMKVAVAPVQQELNSVKEDNTRLLRAMISKDLQGKFPTLAQDDISRVLVEARKNPNIPIAEHAKQAVLAQQTGHESTIKDFCKAKGLNYEDLAKRKNVGNELNKLDEPGPGGLAPLFKGKKIRFTSRAKRGAKVDPDIVSPRDAMVAHLDRTYSKEG